MVELEIDKEQQAVREVNVLLAGDVIARHSSSSSSSSEGDGVGSLCFVIRRPGKCVCCVVFGRRR
jgi:hypothetical protein